MLSTNILQLSLVNLTLANAGVPLFTTNVFWQIVLFIPIVLIELFAHRIILKTNLLKSLKISFIANLLSTLAGVIIVVGFGFLYAIAIRDYFGPPLTSNSFNRFVFFRVLGLLVMWFISVRIEYRSGLFLAREIETKILKRSVVVANTLSYFFLAVVMTYMIVTNLLEARNSIAMIQQDLAEFDKKCPVVVSSVACDEVFHQRIKAYRKLGRIYIRHGNIGKYADTEEQIGQLRVATEKTCLPDDKREVCTEER